MQDALTRRTAKEVAERGRSRAVQNRNGAGEVDEVAGGHIVSFGKRPFNFHYLVQTDVGVIVGFDV